jgi:hypothetical protein
LLGEERTCLRTPWGTRSRAMTSDRRPHRLWCAVGRRSLVGGAGGLVVRHLALRRLLELMVLAVGGRQGGRDPGPPPPAGRPSSPAPTASAPAQRPRAAGGAQPPVAQVPMVDLHGHAPDAAWMAPPHGAPALDLSSAGARPAIGPLDSYVRHDNRHRPHRSLDLSAPERSERHREPEPLVAGQLRRRDVLGGLIHE